MHRQSKTRRCAKPTNFEWTDNKPFLPSICRRTRPEQAAEGPSHSVLPYIATCRHCMDASGVSSHQSATQGDNAPIKGWRDVQTTMSLASQETPTPSSGPHGPTVWAIGARLDKAYQEASSFLLQVLFICVNGAVKVSVMMTCNRPMSVTQSGF